MLNNYVKIAGQVISKPVYSHIFYDEAFYMTYVSVKRTNDKFDIIPVMISENNLVNLHDWIMIVGEFRSYNMSLDGRSKLQLFVFSKCLTPANPNTYTNEITLDGNICKPVIYRTTPKGRKISEICIGVNRAFGKSDYIPCIAWWKTARYASGLSVGTRIEIEGRIQSRDYVKDGVVHQVYEVSSYHITEVK